jgi:hypothetical protein
MGLVMTHFYVYALLNQSGTPFYIGKGKGRRYLHSKRKRQAADVQKLADNLSQEHAFELERFLIDEIGRTPHGPLQNRCVGGYGAAGWKKSAELVEKMASFHRGRKRSVETRRAIGDALVGRKPKPESIEKQRRALTGRKASPEEAYRLRTMNIGRPCPEGTRLALIETNKKRRGIPWSPEHRAKMMLVRAEQGHRAKGRKLSVETRAKISAAHIGKIVPAETRAQMSARQLGRKHSPETRAKMSDTHRRLHSS